MIRAGRTGGEAYVPETVLTNADLEKMVDTNDEWIRTRTGIKERRIFNSPGKGASDLALPAVLKLLETTNTRPEEVELVIVATVTADHTFPDTANILCDKAGIKNAYGFDINAACSGFLFALTTAAQFVMTGRHKKVILVGVDVMSSIVDYTDRATCIIFGDGAGAVMLEPVEDGTGLIDSVLKGDGAGRHVLHMKAGGSVKPASHETVDAREHFVYQEGKHVFKHAVNGMASTVAEIMKRNDLSKEDVAWIVPHQANMRIITSVAEQLDFPIEKVMVNIEKYGNTTSATIPLCLWEWKDKLHKGDNIILTAFGGGFTWGSTLIRWSI